MVPDSHLEGNSQIRGGIPRLLKPVTDVTTSNGLWRDRLLDEFIQGPSAAQVPSFKSPIRNALRSVYLANPIWKGAFPWPAHRRTNPVSSGESIDYKAEDIKAFLSPYRADSVFHTGGYNYLASEQLAQTYSSGSTDYTVKVLVGPDRYRIKYRIDALPDTGAKRNFVSQQLVDSLGLVPKDLANEKFRLPSGATIKSCGTGSFDDIPSSALADTGCDVMLISTNFAIRNSLEIDGNSEHRRTIEYADGSLDTTSGIVHGATWQFRSSWDKITCEFYVLDNLKADIILSSHFIFEHNVFSKFEEDIVDTSLVPGPDFGDIYNIRLISHYSSALQNLEASAIADMNSLGSFSPETIKNERVRRDQIRDAINALPLDQQDQARIDERNRQEIWDGYRRRHFETEGGPIFVIQQVVVDRKQRWWRNRPFWSRLKRRVTKSMLWL
ncbi:hypothetical protein BFJ67_g5884 [Fusarium oxysporum f. sp. cepae]|nr:hypothetical protein BFJ67_g5884 [Fusarium oxysporum f. sp. cepae]